jgi:hypothetical protein
MERYNKLARALAPLFGMPVADRGETNTRVYLFGADAEGVVSACNRVRAELMSRGYELKTFGAEGCDSVAKPDFARDGYSAGKLWIYDPRGGNGALTWSHVYTCLWRASHEYGHAVTKARVAAEYGETRRAGKLGAGMTLHDAEAACFWELLAFAEQARFLADCGLAQTPDAIRAESGINMLDAVVRCLTGEFSDPAKAGIYATSDCLAQCDAWNMARHLLAAFDSGAIRLGE